MERSVQQYAGLMHITSKYLGECVKENLGKTPGDLIQEMIFLETKVLLRQTKMTVSQIADQLSFEDQSYFSKFFKTVSGTNFSDFKKGSRRLSLTA